MINHLIRKIAAKTGGRYLALVLFSGLIASVTIVATYHELFVKELLAGWALALINAAVAFWINRRAIYVKARDSFAWGLGMNGIRVAALFGIILAMSGVGMANFGPFLMTVLICYFCLTFGEIICLHLESLA